MLSENFVYLSLVLNTLGAGGYVLATLKGRAQPNRVTWFLWALAPLIGFAAQMGEGVGMQSLLTFAVGFGPLLVFLASFVDRSTAWKVGPLDIACGVLSGVGIALWLVTRDGDAAIGLTILADFLAAFPTLVKSARFPETEHATAFWLSCSSAVITTLTIDDWDFAHAAFPLYLIFIGGLLGTLIAVGQWRNNARGAAKVQ